MDLVPAVEGAGSWLRGKEVNFRTYFIAALVLVGFGFALTFPPIFKLLAPVGSSATRAPGSFDNAQWAETESAENPEPTGGGVDLATGVISGAEALVRWNHPTRGLVPPAQFIPIAEDSGLILPIGNWVLREACAQARAWQDAGLPFTTMAVNVSAMQLRDEGFLDGLFATLRETGLDPGSLELELTESVLMKQADSAAAILQAVRERGVRVALDDFGTGYSSLSYLRKFPIDALKIDQSFVSHIDAADDDTSIVTAVISMARSLDLRVVAEGVETTEQLAFLQAHRCDQAQGYLFSKPVPPQKFARLLRRGSPLFTLVPARSSRSGDLPESATQ